MTFKIDKEIKKRAKANAESLGIPLSTLINMYLKDFSTTGHIEFQVEQFPAEKMTPKLEKLLEEVEKEIANGEVSPAFDNVEDAIAWLDRPRQHED